jgi:3-methylfumaryl-CoA hydratase
VKRTSRIKDVSLKSGSTGQLCFVAVDHELTTPRGVAIRERHDIVYRDVTPASGASAKPAGPPPAAKHRETHFADPVLLFRYSALTFNGHRIHYDRPYVTEVEGYPGLIVHGPLQASLLLEYAIALRGKLPKTFTHRGVSPLFDGAEFTVNAKESSESGLELWTANSAGAPTMKASASW